MRSGAHGRVPFLPQPFGNPSVLPGYHCARLARSEGIDRILA